MITALLVSAAIVFYVMCGGFLGARTYRTNIESCRKCGSGSAYCYTDHETPAFFAGAFWPVAIPYLVAFRAGTNPTPLKERRTEARRNRELDEAKHKKKLAQLAHEEAMFLDKELKLHGKV